MDTPPPLNFNHKSWNEGRRTVDYYTDIFFIDPEKMKDHVNILWNVNAECSDRGHATNYFTRIAIDSRSIRRGIWGKETNSLH